MGINPRIKPYWGKSQVSSNMVATSSGRVLAGPVLVLLSRLATAAPDSSNFQGKWSREGKKSEVTWKWREKELCVHGGNLKRSIFTLRHALNMPFASKESKGAIYLRFCSISYTSPFLFPGETGPWSTETWQVRLPLAQQKPWGSWAPRWVHRQHRRPRGSAGRWSRWSPYPAGVNSSLARSLNQQWQVKTQAILTYPHDIQRREQHNSLCRQSRSQWI